MKQNAKQIAELARRVDITAASLERFKKKLSLYQARVTSNEADIPLLQKRLDKLKRELPGCIDKVSAYKLSVKTHRKLLLKQMNNLALLKEKDKILKALSKLKD